MRKLLIFIAVVAIVVYGALQITNKLESKKNNEVSGKTINKVTKICLVNGD